MINKFLIRTYTTNTVQILHIVLDVQQFGSHKNQRSEILYPELDNSLIVKPYLSFSF